MCLAALALAQHPRFPMVLAANRDEFFDRPAAPLGWWRAAPEIDELLAGRDLSAGGTWLGLKRRGRLGLLTNVRAPSRADPLAPSRGSLVPDWLAHDIDSDAFWQRVRHAGHNGYNLVAADLRRGSWHWLSPQRDRPLAVAPGLHGLSNGRLDEPWPKVERLTQDLAGALAADTDLATLTRALFAALRRDTPAADEALPRTGVPLEVERWLSPAFIRSPDGRYGTRCATLVITEQADRGARTHVIERTFAPDARQQGQRHCTLGGWPPAA